MGRQIAFHMLPEDCAAFVAALRMRAPVHFTPWSSDSAEIVRIAEPCHERQTLTMWNETLLAEPRRNLIPASDIGPYYRMDERLPILELSTCGLTTWEGMPALIQGRIWGPFRMDAPDPRYAAWFDSIVRWIRRHYTRFDGMLGYVGPEAWKWSTQGLLLPQFSPPATDTWRHDLFAQLAARRAASS